MDISTLLRKFAGLKVDRTKGAAAPHKAILLLSLLQSIDSGEIIENRCFITSDLVARFKDNWHALVHNDKFNPNFSLPFFHLKNDNIWHLRTFPGKEIQTTSSGSIRSFSALKNVVAYGYFSDEIYALLKIQVNRELVKQALLTKYLDAQQLTTTENSLARDVEYQILNESIEKYKKEVAAADEEEVFVRSGIFKKVVPRIYNYTCCISGMKITTTRDIQMIDACHIIPFSESHDDTIKNGISLSPNFHRAFDRFLITINENYEIVISNDFIESGVHSFKYFHGKKIMLPKEPEYRPSMDNLNWHFRRFAELHN